MTTRIIIGNAIALLASVFTVLSALAKGRKKIYGYQVAQCLTMAVASVAFMSASGVVTFLLCALRNYLAAQDRFNRNNCIILSVILVVLGLLANNRGLTGVIPVVTTLIYTLGTLYVKRDRMIKLNAALNLVLWAVYDALIMDFISLAVDAGCAVVTVISAFRPEGETGSTQKKRRAGKFLPAVYSVLTLRKWGS